MVTNWHWNIEPKDGNCFISACFVIWIFDGYTKDSLYLFIARKWDLMLAKRGKKEWNKLLAALIRIKNCKKKHWAKAKCCCHPLDFDLRFFSSSLKRLYWHPFLPFCTMSTIDEAHPFLFKSIFAVITFVAFRRFQRLQPFAILAICLFWFSGLPFFLNFNLQKLLFFVLFCLIALFRIIKLIQHEFHLRSHFIYKRQEIERRRHENEATEREWEKQCMKGNDLSN